MTALYYKCSDGVVRVAVFPDGQQWLVEAADQVE